MTKLILLNSTNGAVYFQEGKVNLFDGIYHNYKIKDYRCSDKTNSRQVQKTVQIGLHFRLHFKVFR
jgi:hypothetical protein